MTLVGEMCGVVVRAGVGLVCGVVVSGVVMRAVIHVLHPPSASTV